MSGQMTDNDLIPSVSVAKDGGAEVPAAGIITNLGDGHYSYTPTSDETSGANIVTFSFDSGVISFVSPSSKGGKR